MHTILNTTPFQAATYPNQTFQGEEALTYVTKAGFSFDEQGNIALLPITPEIIETDEYNNTPGYSTLTKAYETMPFKSGSEWWLEGELPLLRKINQSVLIHTELLKSKQTIKKTLQFHAPTTWQKKLFSVKPSATNLFDKINFSFDHAFGGFCPKSKDYFLANPAGRNFSKKSKYLIGLKTAQLTYPEDNPYCRKTIFPAAFGPLPSLWQGSFYGYKKLRKTLTKIIYNPELSSALTNHQTLQDSSFRHNQAPFDQRINDYFTGSEEFKLWLTPNNLIKPIHFKLPKINVRYEISSNENHHIYFPQWDTLIINLSKKEFYLIGRISVPWQWDDTSIYSACVILSPVPNSNLIETF